MVDIKINVDFIPDRIEVYQLVNTWENQKVMKKPRNILRIDTKGNIIGKEKNNAIS